eukprot:gene857-955_t
MSGSKLSMIIAASAAAGAEGIKVSATYQGSTQLTHGPWNGGQSFISRISGGETIGTGWNGGWVQTGERSNPEDQDNSGFVQGTTNLHGDQGPENAFTVFGTRPSWILYAFGGTALWDPDIQN